MTIGGWRLKGKKGLESCLYPPALAIKNKTKGPSRQRKRPPLLESG